MSICGSFYGAGKRKLDVFEKQNAHRVLVGTQILLLLAKKKIVISANHGAHDRCAIDREEKWYSHDFLKAMVFKCYQARW